MRFKLFDRILLGFLLIIVIAAALSIAAFGLFIVPEYTVEGTIAGLYANNRQNTLIFAGAALLILVISLRLFWALGSGGKKRVPASLAVRSDTYGSVSITVSSIITMVHQMVMSVPGITSSKESLQKTETGIDLVICLSVADDQEIPQKTEEVQQLLLTEVERLSGLPVGQVHIMVEQQAAQK